MCCCFLPFWHFYVGTFSFHPWTPNTCHTIAFLHYFSMIGIKWISFDYEYMILLYPSVPVCIVAGFSAYLLPGHIRVPIADLYPHQHLRNLKQISRCISEWQIRWVIFNNLETAAASKWGLTGSMAQLRAACKQKSYFMKKSCKIVC